MNDANTKIKQQIVEKIKSSTNILVTVSRDPSVDSLAAAIGLVALLNKLDKHATAIFSGLIPPAITFLEPDKVFESTADSLRDFIIALDKEKADHLRYKIEGDVVKIFITPYRTTINSDDLQFSQGDFNVELVLALGVDNQDHLDNALAAHGQILHDVTIATFSAGEVASQLGSIDWHDDAAGGLCEMVTSISEAIKTEKPILDKQIATALLTGIVYSTDRFSNEHTTSKVMTMAAQLMAAGADQQLVAAKLQESHEITSLASTSIKNATETGVALDIPVEPNKTAATEQKPDEPGMLSIEHEEEKPPVEAVAEPAPVATEAVEPAAPVTQPETAPETVTEPVPEPTTDTTTEPTPEPIVPTEAETVSTLPPEPAVTENPFDVESSIPGAAFEPSLGGTLNATTEKAAEDSRRELEDTKNKTILTHSYLSGSEPNINSSINSAGQAESNQNVDIFANSPLLEKTIPAPQTGDSLLAQLNTEPITPPAVNPISTLPPVELGQLTASDSLRDHDELKTAAESIAKDTQPIVVPPALDLPMPPELPDFSTLPPPTSFGSESSTLSNAAPAPTPMSTLPPSDDNVALYQIPGQK